MNIGFIGLGIMGKPMAKNVLKKGYSLYVYNRSQQAISEVVELGAVPCSSSKHVAEFADVIITMLPDTPQVKEVILGESGIIKGITEGKIVVDMSSINPRVAKDLAGDLNAVGAHLLDAPVSGGEVGAIEAKLAIMVGGPESVFNKVKPLLESMGTSVNRVGDIGAGNSVKLINQIIVAVNIAAVSEAFSFGQKAGVDPLLAYEAIRGGLAGSKVMDTKINNIQKEIFKPGFRNRLHAKDLSNAILMGEQVGATMTFTSEMLNMFNQLVEQGFGEEDHSSVYRLF